MSTGGAPVTTDLGLVAHGRTVAGELDVEVDLDVRPGEVVGLLGPNGAGKTTILRALAGLRRMRTGRIAVDGEVLDEPATGRFVPPEQRRVGMVFQGLRLFPHLALVEDVAFGLRARGVPRKRALAVADDWLGRVGLGDRTRSRAGELSGGQAQRAALARALAPDPGLLLLDEPLSALDVATRADVRRTLRTHLDSFTGPSVIVTHDAVDALTLADRLVVLDRGEVIQTGSPAEVARRPGSRWIADLVGVTLVPGRCRGGDDVVVDGGHVLSTAPLDAGSHGLHAGDPVHVTVRPGAVALHRTRPDGSPRNVWPTTVVGVESASDRVRVLTGDPIGVTAEITHAALAELALAPGDEVWVSIKATELDVYPR